MFKENRVDFKCKCSKFRNVQCLLTFQIHSIAAFNSLTLYRNERELLQSQAQGDRQTDICDSIVAFATENIYVLCSS